MESERIRCSAMSMEGEAMVTECRDRKLRRKSE